MSNELRNNLAPIISALGVCRVAERAGVAQPALSLWMAGKPKIGTARIEDVIRACRELAMEDRDQANARLRSLLRISRAPRRAKAAAP